MAQDTYSFANGRTVGLSVSVHPGVVNRNGNVIHATIVRIGIH